MYVGQSDASLCASVFWHKKFKSLFSSCRYSAAVLSAHCYSVPVSETEADSDRRLTVAGSVGEAGLEVQALVVISVQFSGRYVYNRLSNEEGY